MRETQFILNPPEMEAARANTEAEGSGMIGGEVYAGAPERASSSLAVGYGCTYIASETVMIEYYRNSRTGDVGTTVPRPPLMQKLLPDRRHTPRRRSCRCLSASLLVLAVSISGG